MCFRPLYLYIKGAKVTDFYLYLPNRVTVSKQRNSMSLKVESEFLLQRVF